MRISEIGTLYVSNSSIYEDIALEEMVDLYFGLAEDQLGYFSLGE